VKAKIEEEGYKL